MPGTFDEPERLNLSDFFERGSLLETVRKRHPYDFVETYELLEYLYGYRKYYVNLGYWKDGPATEEAGYQLVQFLASKLDLAPKASLVDAGSGMGQAAIDLTRAFDLGRVTGININERQIRFARALTEQSGLSAVIEHRSGDASEVASTLDQGAYQAALAVECIGHFSSAERFFSGIHSALAAGGRLAFCLNIARRPPSVAAKQAMKLSYGFVPHSAELWRARVDAAGFRVVEHGDLTESVLKPAMVRSIEALRQPSPVVERMSRLRRGLTRRGCEWVLRASGSGALSYEYFVVEKPKGAG